MIILTLGGPRHECIIGMVIERPNSNFGFVLPHLSGSQPFRVRVRG